MGYYTAKFVTETPVNDIIAAIREEMSAFSQMQLAVFHENHVCPVCPAWPIHNETPVELLNYRGWELDVIWGIIVFWAIVLPFWGRFTYQLFKQALREAYQKKKREAEEHEAELQMAATQERAPE